MAPSVQITFRDIPPSPSMAAHVERRASKLSMIFNRLLDCHVVMEESHRHSRKGKKFHVRVDLHVPGKELVVSRNTEDSKEDLHATVDDAFDDAERLIEDHARKGQPDLKERARPPHGVVAKVFPDRGYGFIAAEGDGHDVYFHRNSVIAGRFERIDVGTKVRYAEEDGDNGPQASTVYVVGMN